MIFSPWTGHTCINDSIGIAKRSYENVLQVIISCYLLLTAYSKKLFDSIDWLINFQIIDFHRLFDCSVDFWIVDFHQLFIVVQALAPMAKHRNSSSIGGLFVDGISTNKGLGEENSLYWVKRVTCDVTEFPISFPVMSARWSEAT